MSVLRKLTPLREWMKFGGQMFVYLYVHLQVCMFHILHCTVRMHDTYLYVCKCSLCLVSVSLHFTILYLVSFYD